ncbi:hypothetical protein WSM22_17480 [Cytophagales bacterium WSM2-2]|nr:hypothetical protein WSM22_17480 [Cytophagales bacterium WSM2-2]
MKKSIFSLVIVALAFTACTTKDKYDVARYYDLHQQDSVLTSIVTYIFSAPPYTKMQDRFDPKHREFYSLASSRFSIFKYYISEEGTHFFYVVRPGPTDLQKRGVGGYFKMDKNFGMKGFHEVFVTPILPEAEVKGRCTFLFEEMVNHSIDKYLNMEMYVQWPNKASYYDTITYEWKPVQEMFN